ncbi:hypothetical protein P2A08_07265, partial [Xanthomonas perforans]
ARVGLFDKPDDLLGAESALLHVRPLGFTDFIASAGTAQWGQVTDRKDRPPSRRWRFVAALRCALLAQCSLSGAVGPDASPVGSHEAHNALVEKNR